MLKKRILELSYKRKLSHLGSCLSAVDIIDEIYKIKKPNEKFILSAGHAHIAHLVVMEKHGKKIGKIHDIHCNTKDGCDLATGSLGHGLPIAVGMALADRTKRVYCLISDGECAEGSIWEALRIADEQQLSNLVVYVNVNGYSAYDEIDVRSLITRLFLFFPLIQLRFTNVEHHPALKGLDAHYKVLTKEEYETS